MSVPFRVHVGRCLLWEKLYVHRRDEALYIRENPLYTPLETRRCVACDLPVNRRVSFQVVIRVNHYDRASRTISQSPFLFLFLFLSLPHSPPSLLLLPILELLERSVSGQFLCFHISSRLELPEDLLLDEPLRCGPSAPLCR
jgi:hypothetical protein